MFDRNKKRQRCHKRIRAKIIGTAKIPRLCVFRSNKHIHAQLIDDSTGHTILAINDIEKSSKKSAQNGGKTIAAKEAGKLIAQNALKNKIEKIVFDRGGYQYHGRIKAFAEGAREGGLNF